MSVIPMTMTHSSAGVNYRNTVNQRFTNETSAKKNNRKIQRTHSCGGRGGRGGRGNQGRGGRGGCGYRGRGTIRRNDYWEVTGLNGRTIRAHLSYWFKNDRCFNILEKTWLQLTQM